MEERGKKNVSARMQKFGSISNYGTFEKCGSEVQKRSGLEIDLDVTSTEIKIDAVEEMRTPKKMDKKRWPSEDILETGGSKARKGKVVSRKLKRKSTGEWYHRSLLRRRRLSQKVK